LKNKKTQDNNKQERFMQLYGPVHERFVRFCNARAYGDYPPKDLVNETVLTAYENFDKLKENKAFLHFLFGISRNILRNNVRRQKFKGEFDEERLSDELSADTQNGEQLTDVGLLYEALQQLPLEQREALILFELSGFSIKDIMETQNAKESAVKARLTRGRKRLAELLREPAEIIEN